MGNTVYHYKDYSYPDEYKVYNKDKTKHIVFTYTTDFERYVDGHAKLYHISSVLPKTQSNIVVEIETKEKQPSFTQQKRYRVVVFVSKPSLFSDNIYRDVVEKEEVFEDMLEATNYYVKMKAEMDLKCI